MERGARNYAPVAFQPNVNPYGVGGRGRPQDDEDVVPPKNPSRFSGRGRPQDDEDVVPPKNPSRFSGRDVRRTTRTSSLRIKF